MKTVIDVSKWNAITNFELVSKSIDGVIVRAGYRGSNGNADLFTDSRFNPYITELSNYNIPLGAYFTTSAINEEEAIEEADYFINLIKSTNVEFKLPLLVNNDWGSSAHNGRCDKLDISSRTNALLAFIKECNDKGYKCAIFISDEWLTSKLNESELLDIDKILTRIINKTTEYAGCIANKITDPIMIKGIAGIMNSIKWLDESYFAVPEPVVEEVVAPKKKATKKAKVEKPVEEKPVIEEKPIKAKKATKKEKEYKVGSLIKLKEEPVYKTSIASTVSDTLSGKYYVYNTKILNGRIRISDKKAGGESIGWVNIK